MFSALTSASAADVASMVLLSKQPAAEGCHAVFATVAQWLGAFHLPQAELLLTDHGGQAIKPQVIFLGYDDLDWGLHVNTLLG